MIPEPVGTMLGSNCCVVTQLDVDTAVSYVSPDVATVVGYLVVSRPFLDLTHPRHQNSSHSELLEVRQHACVEERGESGSGFPRVLTFAQSLCFRVSATSVPVVVVCEMYVNSCLWLGLLTPTVGYWL